MRKIIAVLIAVVLLSVLTITVYAENQPAPVFEGADEQTTGKLTEDDAIKDYASDKSFAELVQNVLFENWEKITIAAYIVYKLFPVIGGIAKNKKSANSLKATLDAYFGNNNSETNVFALQKATSEAQERFMNDAYEVLQTNKEAVAPISEFISQSKNAEEARDLTAKIALACQSAVNLMATQLNDLVLASPSIGQKKKAEIEAAWIKKEKEISDLVQKVVTSNDTESQM